MRPLTIWASSMAASAGDSHPLLLNTSTQAWTRRMALKKKGKIVAVQSKKYPLDMILSIEKTLEKKPACSTYLHLFKSLLVPTVFFSLFLSLFRWSSTSSFLSYFHLIIRSVVSFIFHSPSRFFVRPFASTTRARKLASSVTLSFTRLRSTAKTTVFLLTRS